MVMGAYADFLLLPAHVVARNAFRKPPGLPFEEAALLEPLACVVHAQAIAAPQSFESCLILGAGAFGLLHALLLRHAGVRRVVIAGRGATRLRWAAELGADEVIDVRLRGRRPAGRRAQRRLRTRPGYRGDRTGLGMGKCPALRAPRRARGFFRRLRGGDHRATGYPPHALRQSDAAGALPFPSRRRQARPRPAGASANSARSGSSTAIGA